LRSTGRRFFFSSRRRHTRSYGDWSSDVCSSDLRAYELGMISQIVDPPERLRDEAQALAEKIARNSPAAMRATKRALWGALEQGRSEERRVGKECRARWGSGP